ncbi:hypothetical protein LMG29739_03104 [Paraburkholderia solisilvae]|uniref:Uncharacterized protein n=1 Tax=Paraburkholderia solisilvae TaxID=624376 RepID=A0A6J5E1X3_9BURK|nr:hypothetical protein LMG29739_03104 [Paraburkholderia solisilvae]
MEELFQLLRRRLLALARHLQSAMLLKVDHFAHDEAPDSASVLRVTIEPSSSSCRFSGSAHAYRLSSWEPSALGWQF